MAGCSTSDKEHVKAFKHTCRAELSVVDNIVLKGNKFFIPVALHTEMLCKTQEGHLGEDMII